MVVLDSLLHRVLCFCSVCFFLLFLFFPLCLLTISPLSHFSYVLINCFPPFFFFTVASPLSPFSSVFFLTLSLFVLSFFFFCSLSFSPVFLVFPLYSALLSVLISASLLFSSLRFTFSVFFVPLFFHRLSLAFISQRMACGATSNLVTACRGIVAVKHAP